MASISKISKKKSPLAGKQEHIRVNLPDGTKIDKWLKYRSDGRLRYAVNKGVMDYKEDGTQIYAFDYIYGRDADELQMKIWEYYSASDEKTKQKEIFVLDIKEWFNLEFFKNIKPTTYDRYEEVLLHQIIPEAKKLEHKKFKEITTEDCKIIIKNISLQKSESTVKKVFNLLKAYFDDKVDAGIIPKNPARFKKRGSTTLQMFEPSETELEEDIPIYLDDEEINRIKDIIDNGYDIECKSRSGKVFQAHNIIPQGRFFIFMLNTGLRAGEAVALKYSDIDFEKNLMTVRSNVTYVKKRDENGNAIGGMQRMEYTPKTPDSKATVRINQKAITILQEMKKEEPDGYMGYIVHDTRAPSDSFTPQKNLSSHALYQRWQNLCKHAKVTPRGLHCLRHTCASHLFAVTKGNALAVSELLRHSDVSFTEKIYIDIINKYRDSIFQEFEI